MDKRVTVETTLQNTFRGCLETHKTRPGPIQAQFFIWFLCGLGISWIYIEPDLVVQLLDLARFTVQEETLTKLGSLKKLDLVWTWFSFENSQTLPFISFSKLAQHMITSELSIIHFFPPSLPKKWLANNKQEDLSRLCGPDAVSKLENNSNSLLQSWGRGDESNSWELEASRWNSLLCRWKIFSKVHQESVH